MNSAVLKLISLLRKPSQLDSDICVVDLDSGSPPARLVVESNLAKAVLGCPDAAPYDLLKHWRAVTGLDSLPFNESIFRRLPFFLHGADQFDARRSLMPLYKQIEKDLSLWLPALLSDWVAKVNRTRLRVQPIECAATLSEVIFRTMSARVLRLPPSELEGFERGPGLFQSLLRAEQARSVEGSLQKRMDQARKRLDELNARELLYPLLSIVVMGREPFQVALAYALSQPNIDEIESREVFATLAPVNVIGRTFVSSVELEGIQFQEGQHVHLALQVIAERESLNPGLEFGYGVHKCVGQRLSLLMVDMCLEAFQELDLDLLGVESISLTPDFVVRAK